MKTSILTALFMIILNPASIYAAGYFDKADINQPYEKIMAKANDSSKPINSNYLRRMGKQKIQLHSSQQVNQGQPIANSVVINNGATVNGDVIVNIEIKGDTYVAGEGK